MDEDLMKSYKISKEYCSEKFALCYRKLLVDHILPQEAFVNECLQKIYHSGRISGTRLLDFGCGPTVHRIASASLQFNDIVLAEWSEANRIEVQKWLCGDKNALDWTILLEQCARAEGYRDLEAGVVEIERRIRKTVRKVVHCDALSKDILPEGIGGFDVINSCYCLESCCSTTKIYKEVLQKLTKHLKRGGVMVMVSALEAETYVTHKTLPALYLTEEIIKEALSEAGLELGDWFCWRDRGKCDVRKYGGISVYYAVKI